MGNYSEANLTPTGDRKSCMAMLLINVDGTSTRQIALDERSFTANDTFNGVRLKIPKRYLFLTHEFMTSRL